MLLQWTLLQLASLGIDDSASNKSSTGLAPNLTSLIGASQLLRPPPLLSQLLLPNTPAEISPSAQEGCRNHTSGATPAPPSPPTAASVPHTVNTSKPGTNIPTVTTQSVTTKATSKNESNSLLEGVIGDLSEATSSPAIRTTHASVPEPTTPSSTTTPKPAIITTVPSTEWLALATGAVDANTQEETTAAAPPTIPASETTPEELTIIAEDAVDVRPGTTTTSSPPVSTKTVYSETESSYQSLPDTEFENEVLEALEQLSQTVSGTSQPTSSTLTSSTASVPAPLTDGSSDILNETQPSTPLAALEDMETDAITLPPIQTIPVTELPTTATTLPTSTAEVPADESGDMRTTKPTESAVNVGTDTATLPVTPVSRLPTTATPLQPFPTKVPDDVSWDTQTRETTDTVGSVETELLPGITLPLQPKRPYPDVALQAAVAAALGLLLQSQGPGPHPAGYFRPSLTSDSHTAAASSVNLTEETLENEVASNFQPFSSNEALIPVAAQVPGITTSPLQDLNANIVANPIQQGTLELKPGSDNTKLAAAKVSEPAPGVIAKPKRPTSADITLGSSQQGTLKIKQGTDTIILAPATVPDLILGITGSPLQDLNANIVVDPTQQGTLELKPGSDDTIQAAAKVSELSPGVTANPKRPTSADIILGPSQQRSLKINQGTDNTIRAAAKVSELAPGVIAKPKRPTSADITLGPSQQGTLKIKQGTEKVVSRIANVPEFTPGVVARPSLVLTGDTGAGITQQGTLGLKPESETVESASANVPLITPGVVATPSHQLSGVSEAGLTLGTLGLIPGSARTGIPMPFQLPPGVSLEQYLAPIISALLLKGLQQKPQYRFGRSVSPFESEEETKTSIKDLNCHWLEELIRLAGLRTRNRRSADGLFARYQLVQSAIDKFLDMRPRTQDFLVQQGVKMAAKKVGEIVRSYDLQVKDWVNEKLSSMGLADISSSVADQVEKLMRLVADNLENYIVGLPH